MTKIITSTVQVKGLLMSLNPVIKMTDDQLNNYIDGWFMVEAGR